jgi:hypothetical protein
MTQQAKIGAKEKLVPFVYENAAVKLPNGVFTSH